MMSNPNLDADSPLACLLVGQPTLRRTMKLAVLAALEQRVALRYAMPPMTSAETASYITHHLKLAGRSDPLFSDDAVTLNGPRGNRIPAPGLVTASTDHANNGVTGGTTAIFTLVRRRDS